MTMRMNEPRIDVPYEPCNGAIIDHSIPSLSKCVRDSDTMEQVLGDSFGNLTIQSPRRKSLRSADAVDVERLRSETKKLLILCLQSQLPREAGQPENSQQKIEKMATTLEMLLFQMSPTLVEYSDVRTLQMRLKIALPRARQLLRISARKQSNKRQNTSALEASLGTERFNQIKELVDSIRHERLQVVGASCAKCQYMRRIEGKPQLVGSQSFGTEFPDPVKQLFFGTALVHQWDRKHLNASWDPMVEQAQANLDAFRRWKAENYVCQR